MRDWFDGVVLLAGTANAVIAQRNAWQFTIHRVATEEQTFSSLKHLSARMR